MKKFTLKALAAATLTAGLVLAGVTTSAQAATISPTATATGVIGATGTNAYPITFTATTVGSTSNLVQVMLPSGWTFATTPPNNCTWLTVTGITPNSCMGNNGGGVILQMGSQIPAGTTVTVELPANTLNAASSRNFVVMFENNSSGLVTVDSGIAVLAGAVTNYTVAFDANGGSGSMSDQTSSSAITLTPNAFTRTNYNFAGWNTAADGSGTAYADVASYPFTSSATLYAQWTPTLANTGMSDFTWQMGEITLALMGFGILLYIRQRKRNA